jgi:hypothetical protein
MVRQRTQIWKIRSPFCGFDILHCSVVWNSQISANVNVKISIFNIQICYYFSLYSFTYKLRHFLWLTSVSTKSIKSWSYTTYVLKSFP